MLDLLNQFGYFRTVLFFKFSWLPSEILAELLRAKGEAILTAQNYGNR